MDGDGFMRYNWAAMDELAGSIDTRVSTIQTLVEDLRTKVDNLANMYEGSASDGFRQTKSQWETAAADLNAVLARISTAVKTTAADAHATETRNAGRW